MIDQNLSFLRIALEHASTNSWNVCLGSVPLCNILKIEIKQLGRTGQGWQTATILFVWIAAAAHTWPGAPSGSVVFPHAFAVRVLRWFLWLIAVKLFSLDLSVPKNRTLMTTLGVLSAYCFIAQPTHQRDKTFECISALVCSVFVEAINFECVLFLLSFCVHGLFSIRLSFCSGEGHCAAVVMQHLYLERFWSLHIWNAERVAPPNALYLCKACFNSI